MKNYSRIPQMCKDMLYDGYALEFSQHKKVDLTFEDGLIVVRDFPFNLRVYTGNTYEVIAFDVFLKSASKLVAKQEPEENIQTCAKCRHLYASVYRDKNGKVRNGCIMNGHSVSSFLLDDECVCPHFEEETPNETND